MLRIKNMSIFIAFLAVLATYCEEQRKGTFTEAQIQSLDETEQKISSELISHPENLTLISEERTKYSVPFKIAMQSNLIETSLKDDQDAKEIVLAVEDEYLQPLIQALSITYKYKNFMSTKELYEKIQQELYLKAYTLPELSTLFIKADYLDNKDLQNSIFDYFAQLILDGSISLGDLIKIINPAQWYLIEKYYYLRSPDLKVGPDKLLFQNNKELVDKLYWIVPAPQEFSIETVGKRIIYRMNLSIQDLLDYDKDIQVRLETNLQLLKLDLRGFSLKRLDGLENVAGIAEAQYLDLSNNLLTELHENIFNGLGNFQVLSLTKNQLTELPENIFNGLGNLKGLSLSDNQLTELHENSFNGLGNLKILSLDNNKLTELHKNIFNGLGNLKILHLSNNPLTQASKNMLMQFKQNHPNTNW